MHFKKYFLDKGELRIRNILNAVTKVFTDEATLDMSVQKCEEKVSDYDKQLELSRI